MSLILPPPDQCLRSEPGLDNGDTGAVVTSAEEGLMRLQEWVITEYKHVSAVLSTDVTGSPYLSVKRTSPHPVLVTCPSLTLICRVNSELQFTCLVQSFNLISIKEIHAAFEEEKVCLLMN